jgi:hypothetical protein
MIVQTCSEQASGTTAAVLRVDGVALFEPLRAFGRSRTAIGQLRC